MRIVNSGIGSPGMAMLCTNWFGALYRIRTDDFLVDNEASTPDWTDRADVSGASSASISRRFLGGVVMMDFVGLWSR